MLSYSLLASAAVANPLKTLDSRLNWRLRRWLRVSGFVSSRRRRTLLLPAAALTLLLLVTAIAPTAQAQTYSVIHNFTGGADGANPTAGVSIDRSGNLYGTTTYGGNTGGNCGTAGCGTVYRLVQRNSSWLLTPLYRFNGGTDGVNPKLASVLIGSDGSLYSTTYYGGTTCNGVGCGTVFKLQPPANACSNVMCAWSETVLHRFSNLDGAGPVGALIFDTSGDLFGVTITGGLNQGGTVYKLNSGNWAESILYHPYGYPGSGVTMDHAGNLFGSTFIGGSNLGSVYQLTFDGSGWEGANIYDFTNGSDGAYPWAGVTFDESGNIYGATSTGGTEHGGVAFELTPSNGGWNYNELYSFAGPGTGQGVVGPIGTMTIDNAGNLYGTTVVDGANGYGAVFKLTHTQSGWSYTSLHDFTNGDDGAYPYSSLVFDSVGNLYGTASAGGTNALGVVFEISE